MKSPNTQTELTQYKRNYYLSSCLLKFSLHLSLGNYLKHTLHLTTKFWQNQLYLIRLYVFQAEALQDRK